MRTINKTNEILTLQEIAKYLRVSKKTIYRLVEARKLPIFRVGYNIRITKKELDEWIERGKSRRSDYGRKKK